PPPLLRVVFSQSVRETLSVWGLSTVILAMTCRIFSGGGHSWVQMGGRRRGRRGGWLSPLLFSRARPTSRPPCSTSSGRAVPARFLTRSSLVLRLPSISECRRRHIHDFIMDKPTPRTPSDLTSGASQNAASPATVHGTSSSSAYVTVLSCVAAIGGFLFGFDSGVINGTVDALAKAFGTNAAGTGFAVASVLLGCAVGAFGAGRLADSIGRRPTMLFNAVLFLASAVATGAANSAGFFIVARIASGIAIGAASVLAPMYIAEVAP